jgi:hypothetical protein
MGTNIFVEGNPLPVLVSITLPIETTTFRDLRKLALALSLVDDILSKDWAKMWPEYSRRSKRESILVSFRINSPPEFTILTDPAWIAIFLAVLARYKDIKSNTREIISDIKYLVDTIKGLTARELELLEIAIRLTSEKMIEYAETETKSLVSKTRKIQRLLHGMQKALGITIRKIDKDNM